VAEAGRRVVSRKARTKTTSGDPSLVWFRHDLRLQDHPALDEAAGTGAPVIPVYIHAPEEEGAWAPGEAGRWWLHQSLKSLDAGLRRLGSRLVLRRGASADVLAKIAGETGARTVFWHARYEPAAFARDEAVEAGLLRRGLKVRALSGSLLHEPQDVCTKQWTPFQVFTPFWRACTARGEPPVPLPAPARLEAPKRWPKSVALGSLGLEPKLGWTTGLQATWPPGPAGAAERLSSFLEGATISYHDDRDRPDLEGTSKLSPYLHVGAISSRQVWHEVRAWATSTRRSGATEGADAFLRQLIWREFAYHLLCHFPETPEQPLRSKYAAFPWSKDPQALRAWQRGRTGYPFVDAGMRQLWATGWMHNRVRMVVASFLVKHLLLPWQVGAEWFWDTLVDADLANNTLGWQWAAGCGADAAPYFRIFNPVTQGKRYDPDGDYVRQWVPELSQLPTKWLHEPWAAPKTVLSESGIELGQTYPEPIVEHAFARKRALAALASIKGVPPSPSPKRSRGRKQP